MSGSPLGVQTPGRWNMIGRSATAPPLVLSPTSILTRLSSGCAFISSRKNSARFSKMLRIYFRTSLICLSMKLRNLKLRKFGSVCTKVRLLGVFLIIRFEHSGSGCYCSCWHFLMFLTSRLVPVMCGRKQLVGNMSSVTTCSGTRLILLSSVASRPVYVIIWSVVKAVLGQGYESCRELYQPLQNSMRLKGPWSKFHTLNPKILGAPNKM